MLVAAGVAALLAVLAPAVSAVSPPSAPALTVTDNHVRAVVIAVPDLRWSDLAYMPKLRAFAGTAAVGDLSVKTVESRADCADGLLTFNAGDRVDSGVGGCSMTPAQLKKARVNARGSVFDAHVGALGDALRSAGLVTSAVDTRSIPLLVDSTGDVTVTPFRSIVRSNAPEVDAIVDDDLYVGRPDQRPVTAGLLDGEIHDQVAELAPQTTVFIAGLSDAPAGHAHLHVLLVRHQGWSHVELARPGTHPPYVSLIDLAPTLLHLLGRAPPADLAGRVLRPTATPARDWTAYADQDRHAQAARSTSKPLRYTLAIAALAVILLLVLAGRGVGARLSGAAATWLARLLVGVPVFAFMVQLLPWWRSGGLAVAGMFAGAAVAFAAVTAATARRAAVVALVIVPGFTAVVLLADQLAGSRLQISSALGDNPLIGGRFHGMGNIDFAVFATCALLCAGVAGGALVSRGRRTLGLAAAAAIGGVALVVDGAPPLGDDAGGAVTLLTAVVLMLAVLTGVRVTWQRVLVVLVVAVALVVLVGVADHARGAAAQTHLGRFVGQLMHGGAGAEVRRRLIAVGRSFGNVPMTLLAAGAAAASVACRGFLRRRAAQFAGLPAALAGVATVAILGTLFNDSGVVIAAFALIVAVGALAGAGLLAAAAPGPMPDQAG
ncbi:MAG TPA: hypothetical protein VFJ17_08770 [Mycobacteriales bacterium]|nr:hypothetical protein [Mycobacteriales bacterium]